MSVFFSTVNDFINAFLYGNEGKQGEDKKDIAGGDTGAPGKQKAGLETGAPSHKIAGGTPAVRTERRHLGGL
jgi:hypothetical protein